METALQPEINQFNRLLTRFTSESKTIVIASISLVVTVLSLLIAFMALDDAKHARIQAEFLKTQNSEMRDEIEVYRIRSAKLDAWLKAKGVPVEEIYNDVSRTD